MVSDGEESTENLNETIGVAANRESDSQNPDDPIEDNEGYGDPETIPENADMIQLKEYRKAVDEYCEMMITCLEDT